LEYTCHSLVNHIVDWSNTILKVCFCLEYCCDIYVVDIGNLLIRSREFQAVVRAIAQPLYPHIRWQGSAILRLQMAAEAFLAGYFEMAHASCLHAKRKTISKSDLVLVNRIARLGNIE
jgi:histone H3/H4